MNGNAKRKRNWLISFPDMRYANSFALIPNFRSIVVSVDDR